jgi:UDP-glucose 4-epimerase
MKKILVTGGTGYIGSHIVVELLELGYHPIIFDNLSNSSSKVLTKISSIIDQEYSFIKGDLCNFSEISDVFKVHDIDSVIHLAGFKSVKGSIQKPLEYFDNNITGTINLLKAMVSNNIMSLVFSSSATVYGKPVELPLRETSECGQLTNPYAKSKKIIEDMIMDISKSNKNFNTIILRYFNPVGAHHSGEIGEDPDGIPANIMPFISKVAVGAIKEVKIFGDNYETHDGTGVRDYIHVVDLANAHIKAISKISKLKGANIFNIGTGIGYSVLQLIDTYESVSGQNIPYKIEKRRKGDVDICFSDPSKANFFLDWQSKKSLMDMCKDSWNWQSKNPRGY